MKSGMFAFVPNWRYFEAFTAPDVRLGGFGPLLGLITLVIAVGISLCGRFNPNQWKIVFVSALLLISGLINPEAWWARYVPQIWLAFVGLTLVLIASDSRQRYVKWFGVIALSLMAINSIGVAGVTTAAAYSRSNLWRTTLTELATAPGTKLQQIYIGNHIATTTRLDAFNVKYRLVPNQRDCSNPAPLIPVPRSYLSTALKCG